jgi:tRNA threonylcarbamoyladenosine biosynthesis protein TsaB
MEVYSAIYDPQHNEIRSTEAEELTSESYYALLELSPVYFIGNGVAKTKDIICHKNAQFIENKLPSAKQMCALSYTKFKNNDFEDVAYFEPFYLKDFIAIPSKK